MLLDTEVFLSGKLVSIEDASPVIIRWAYEAGAIYHRFTRFYDTSSILHLQLMKEKLKIMSQRWLAAGIVWIFLFQAMQISNES